MSTRHLVHPSLQLMTLPEVAFTMSDEILTNMRIMRASPIGAEAVEHLEVTSETLWATCEDGHKVRLVMYRPANSQNRPLAVIYHIHGGGMVMGSPEMMEVRNKLLVDRLGVAVVSVDYRLAPENPYPIPLEDCYVGLIWLLNEASRLGIDTSRVVCLGESAGGGLAAGLGLLLRDRAGPSLLGQYLIYPMIDDRTGSTLDPAPIVGEFIWNRASNRYGWTSYLGYEPGGADVPIYAAPARAEDLSGLPATFMYTGSLDLFLEEDIDFAKRLLVAGVPTELHVYPGGIHAFEMVSDGPLMAQASTDLLRSLTDCLIKNNGSE